MQTLEEIVAEIHKLSASVRDGLMSRMRTRRFRLERLLEVLLVPVPRRDRLELGRERFEE